MPDISVRRNPREKCWEVLVVIGGRKFGRLFHYKADAQQYATIIQDPHVLSIHLWDALKEHY